MARHNSVDTVTLVFGGFFALVLLLVLGGITMSAINFFHVEEKTCTVEDKYALKGDDGSTFRVETSDCGILEVQDSMFRGVWDSADRYAQIEPGQTYDMTLVGYRLPFFSMFPNALEVK